MEIKEHKWDISLLEKMKSELLHNSSLDTYYRDKDIKLIEELLSFVNRSIFFEHHSFEERRKRVLDNQSYRKKQIDAKQALYLGLLERKLCNLTPVYQTEKRKFQIEEILQLLKEFIEWFPSKQLGQFLKIYYERDFPTHFYYCKKKSGFIYRGMVYRFNYFLSPFMVVTKEDFIETFITMVHEMGHVLTYVLDLEFSRSKCGDLFSEIDGRYFEELAKLFLFEKNLYPEACLKSSIDSYNDIREYLIKVSKVGRTFFTYDAIEDILCEIYSYLGSLELLDRYNGDYEKQLYDLAYLSDIQSDDMSEYLKDSGFLWREDGFKVLEKRKEWLRNK